MQFLGSVLTCWDLLGSVQMHCDTFGCIWVRQEEFGHFRTTSQNSFEKCSFRNFCQVVDNLRNNGHHWQAPCHFSIQVHLLGDHCNRWNLSWKREMRWWNVEIIWLCPMSAWNSFGVCSGFVWISFDVRSASAQGTFGAARALLGLRLESVRQAYKVRVKSVRGPSEVVRRPLGIRAPCVQKHFEVRNGKCQCTIAANFLREALGWPPRTLLASSMRYRFKKTRSGCLAGTVEPPAQIAINISGEYLVSYSRSVQVNYRTRYVNEKVQDENFAIM